MQYDLQFSFVLSNTIKLMPLSDTFQFPQKKRDRVCKQKDPKRTKAKGEGEGGPIELRNQKRKIAKMQKG